VFGSVAPHSGSFQAFFGPVGSTGGIFQDLTTVAGQTYNLTFWMYNFGGTPSSFSASWDGAVIPASVLVDPGAFRYTQFSFTGLLASGTSTQLAFTFQQNPSYFLLDNVTVTSGTPDGGNTLSLLGLAMVGICLIRRWAPARVK
jgi:hypothetical protein